MAKTLLTAESPNENRQRIIRFAEIWRIDLAGVAGEDHFGAFANSRQNCFECGGLEVLRFVDHNNLPM